MCRGRAVVPADPGGQGSHGSMVEVQGAAVRGVRIQGPESCLPSLRKSTQLEIRFWLIFSISPVFSFTSTQCKNGKNIDNWWNVRLSCNTATSF